MSLPHRIRRLRWNASAASAGDAFAVRALLRERGDAVHAALDRALQDAAVDARLGDAVVHLGRVELQFSAASLDALAADFEQGLELAARGSLQAALRDLKPLNPAVSEPAASPARTGAVVARRDALRHYLTHGVHHWTLAGVAAEEGAQALRAAASEAIEGHGGIEALLADVVPARERIGALLRWLALLTPAQRRAWVAREPRGDGLAAVAAALTALRAAADGDAPEALLPQALWLAWPDAADEPAQRRWHHELAAWLPTLPQVSAPVLRELAAALARPVSGLAPPAAQPAPPQAARDAEAADASLLVPLAGLVLLHPYLVRLLSGCGITDAASREIPAAALPRACGLLHWLATGRDEAPEYELPLVKLLLGLPPDRPLDVPPVAPTQADRDEAQALLAAVLQHWSALRGTSADGLRLSFLQRRGLLARADGGWMLRVQPEGFDLLLAMLPWTLGWVRLPWMPQMLQVEWGTA